MKFLANVDLAGNELRTAVIEVRTSDPSTGRVGQVYFNSASSRLRVCTVAGSPGTWKDLLIGPLGSGDITDGSLVDADFSPTAALQLSKLAVNPLARANHTGTQTASTISDFTTQRDAQRLDQHQPPTAPVSAGSQRITNVANPTASSDAANKSYVDGAIAGLDWKTNVRTATTLQVAGGLAAPSTATIGGVALSAGDRVLVKDEVSVAQADNGIYIFNGTGTPMTRASDADTWQELTGASVVVEEGTNADTAWLCTVDSGGTLGSSLVTWSRFPGGVTAGDGLTLTGNTLDIGAGTGINVLADAVSISTSLVARKLLTTITGDGATTSFTVTHNFSNSNPVVQVLDDATNDVVAVDIGAGSGSLNSVSVRFASPPANGVVYRVTVIG